MYNRYSKLPMKWKNKCKTKTKKTLVNAACSVSNTGIFFSVSGKKFLWKESLPFTIYGLLVNLLCNSRYLGLLRCTMAVAA